MEGVGVSTGFALLGDPGTLGGKEGKLCRTGLEVVLVKINHDGLRRIVGDGSYD